MTYPKGSKPTICDCPFTDWCEDGRQHLQGIFRNENKNYKVTDCDFYKLIKEKDEEIIARDFYEFVQEMVKKSPEELREEIKRREDARNNGNKEQQIRSLGSHQIASLIKKGKWVEELKAEWLRRWGMEFPYFKDISGIQEMK